MTLMRQTTKAAGRESLALETHSVVAEALVMEEVLQEELEGVLDEKMEGKVEEDDEKAMVEEGVMAGEVPDSICDVSCVSAHQKT